MAETNMLFILDSSNSMWGQIDGTAKISTAKSVLANLLTDLPGDTRVGLMAYGHRAKGDCRDVELLAGIGGESTVGLLQKIKGITPKGSTPIAASLRESEGAFARIMEENNHVVLISDGIETCEGDPCKVAADLVAKGLNVRVHVVGFEVDADARRQLQCIAEAGNGRYFDAQSAQALQQAVTEVRQVAQAEPEPKPATATAVFRDDFDGEDLADHWEVFNPNPDAFIVEDGNLLVISSTPASLAEGNIGNLIRLNAPLPEGNWTATAKINVDFQSLNDRVFFGLYDDEKNHLVNVLSLDYDHNWDHFILSVSADKALRGAMTTSNTRVWTTEKGSDIAGVGQGQPYLLRLEKKGREYMGSIKLEGVEEPQWIPLPALRLLRSKGNLAIGVYRTPGGSGEISLMVDSIKVEASAK
jgi:hypothetical protein